MSRKCVFILAVIHAITSLVSSLSSFRLSISSRAFIECPSSSQATRMESPPKAEWPANQWRDACQCASTTTSGGRCRAEAGLVSHRHRNFQSLETWGGLQVFPAISTQKTERVAHHEQFFAWKADTKADAAQVQVIISLKEHIWGTLVSFMLQTTYVSWKILYIVCRTYFYLMSKLYLDVAIINMGVKC